METLIKDIRCCPCFVFRREISKRFSGTLLTAMSLVLIGTIIGLAGTYAMTRLMSHLLFEVTPTDVATFAAVPLILLTVALIACLIPARRATKVDPLVALRYE